MMNGDKRTAQKICPVCGRAVETRWADDLLYYAPHLVVEFGKPGQRDCEASWMKVVDELVEDDQGGR